MTIPATPRPLPFSRRHMLALGAAACLMIAAGFLLPLEEWIHALRQWTAARGVLGQIVFALAYAALNFALAPGGVLMLAAGLAFGLGGVVPVMGGVLLGAVAGFAGGRWLARDTVARMIAQRPRLRALDEATAQAGWRIVLMLRLSGMIPFTLQNLTLGATRVRFVPYLLATLAGTAPATLTYVWLGAVGGEAASGTGPLTWVLLGLSVTATIVMAAVLAHRGRRLLTRHGVREDEPGV